MADISKYRFEARKQSNPPLGPFDTCEPVQIYPPIVTGPLVVETIDLATGQHTYDVQISQPMVPVFQAYLTVPQTIPPGLSNLPCGVEYIAPSYAPLFVDNVLQLPRAKRHLTFFTRSAESSTVGAFFDAQKWVMSSRITGFVFPQGKTIAVSSYEGFDAYTGNTFHTAYPGFRVNNATGSTINLNSGFSIVSRLRMISCQCFFLGNAEELVE